MKNNAKIYSSLAMLVLCGIYLPVLISGKVDIDTIAPLVSLISFLLLVISAKKWTAVIPSAILYFIIAVFFASVGAATAVICIFAAIAMGAYTLTLGDKFSIALVGLTFPISFGISLALTEDIIIALASLIIYPAIIILGVCTRNFINRKDTVIYMTFGCFACGIGLILILLYRYDIPLSDIRVTVEGIKDYIVNYMANYTVNMGNEVVNIFKEASFIRQYIDSLVNIVPGVMIMLLILFSFFCESYLFSMLKKDRLIEYMTSDVMEINISLACAIIYILTFILSFTTNSEGNEMFWSAVMKNVYISLSPALIYVAFYKMCELLRKRRMIPVFLLIFPVIFLSVYGLLTVTLSFIGATAIIAAKAKQYAEGGNKKEND